MITAIRQFLAFGIPNHLIHNIALLLLRLGITLPLALTHGRYTWQAWMAGETGFPDPLGLGSATSMFLVGVAEFFCSWAVAIGLFTRLTVLPLVFNFSVAFLLFHAADPFGNKELPYLYLLGSLLILLAGPGRFSLDALILKPKNHSI